MQILTTRLLVLIVAAAAISAGLTACSGSSGGAVPATANAQLLSRYPSGFAKERAKIEQFADLPQYSDYYGPSDIASGPSKSLWVTDVVDQDFGENAIVQIATSGKALNTFYYSGLTSEGSSLAGIAAGSDGALWMTDEYNEQILRMTTSGEFTNFRLSTPPFAITSGPDKALWFTEYSAIGRITTSGVVSTYTASGGIFNITSGPGKALWFTESTGNAVGRVTTNGNITIFTKGLSPGADPWGIAAGPDGALWFAENGLGRIGRITTDGKVTEFSRGITTSEHPVGIAAGPDGAMWFTEYETPSSYGVADSKIGRITMDGKITEYSKGITSTAGPGAIVAGPDGAMWFVESYTDETGRVKL